MIAAAAAAAVSVAVLALLGVRRLVRSWHKASQAIANDQAETDRIRAERASRGNGSTPR